MASPLRPLRLIIFQADAATLVARSRGMFAAEGLDVSITITPNSTEYLGYRLDGIRQRPGLVRARGGRDYSGGPGRG
jgi:hypothetical protein